MFSVRLVFRDGPKHRHGPPTSQRSHSAVVVRPPFTPRWRHANGATVQVPGALNLQGSPRPENAARLLGTQTRRQSNTRLGQRRKAQTTRMESSGDMGVPGCKREIDCEEAGALSGIALIRRLPQLDLVAIQIVNPRESAVVVVLPLRIDTHALPAIDF